MKTGTIFAAVLLAAAVSGSAADFDELRSFRVSGAGAAAAVEAPPAARAEAAVDFQTMGRHEGGRADAGPALVSIETQLLANGAPDLIQFEMTFPELPGDKEALAVDPGALVMTVSVPLKDYSAIFEGERFVMKTWDLGGKNVDIYSAYNGSNRFIQITQRSGATGLTEVLKLIVAGKAVSMGQLEKFSSGSDSPYFSEYIVMAEKVAQGLALKSPDLLGRVSDPALISYAAQAPTRERFREVLGR